MQHEYLSNLENKLHWQKVETGRKTSQNAPLDPKCTRYTYLDVCDCYCGYGYFNSCWYPLFFWYGFKGLVNGHVQCFHSWKEQKKTPRMLKQVNVQALWNRCIIWLLMVTFLMYIYVCGSKIFWLCQRESISRPLVCQASVSNATP